MTQKQFETEATRRGFTLTQLRCDVRPSPELLEFMDEVGGRYEQFVTRLANKGKPKVDRPWLRGDFSTLDFASIEVAAPCDEPEYIAREASN